MNSVEIEAELKSVVAKVNKVYEILDEAISTGRNTFTVHTKIQTFEDNFERISKDLNILIGNVKTLMASEKFTENFSDSDLKGMYAKTSLQLKDVKRAIEAEFPDKKDITLSQVHNYIMGKTKDLKVREFIGRFLRNEIANQNN